MTKQWTESKGRRTRSWKGNPDFDKFLGEMDISSLRFTVENKRKNIAYYKNILDMTKAKNQQMVNELQDEYDMAYDELVHREMDVAATVDKNEQFDSQTGCVIDEDGNVTSYVAFNEEEDGYVTFGQSTNTTETYEDEEIVDDVDEFFKEPERKVRSRKDVYKDWDYTKG
jgi:hypothetical protein